MGRAKCFLPKIWVFSLVWAFCPTHLPPQESCRNCILFGHDCLTICLMFLQGKNYFWVECSKWPRPNARWFFRGAMELHKCSFFYRLHRQQRIWYPWMGARYVLCHLVRCVVLSQKSITVSSYDMVFEATFFLKKKRYGFEATLFRQFW